MSQRTFLTEFDQSLGLMPLVMRAVGHNNLENIDWRISLEVFPFIGKGVRIASMWVEPCLKGETIEMTADRLDRDRYNLASTADLAGFLHDYPNEVEKWNWVFAFRRKQKSWLQMDPVQREQLPGASVVGNSRRFWKVFDPHLQYDGPCGILVYN